MHQRHIQKHILGGQTDWQMKTRPFIPVFLLSILAVVQCRKHLLLVVRGDQVITNIRYICPFQLVTQNTLQMQTTNIRTHIPTMNIIMRRIHLLQFLRSLATHLKSKTRNISKKNSLKGITTRTMHSAISVDTPGPTAVLLNI